MQVSGVYDTPPWHILCLDIINNKPLFKRVIPQMVTLSLALISVAIIILRMAQVESNWPETHVFVNVFHADFTGLLTIWLENPIAGYLPVP